MLLLSLNYLIAEKTTTNNRNAARLIQFIYFKNALTQIFKSKDKLLGKRISIFVSTENEKLWISSRLMWFDQARPPETVTQMIQHSKQLRQSLADYCQDFCIFFGPPYSALYQQEVVWKERRPNSQILFINVCFHLNGLGYKWL